VPKFTIKKKPLVQDLKHVSLIIAVSATILFWFDQISWADTIHCPNNTTATCYGTSEDDMIFGPTGTGGTIHGLGGNDYIIGAQDWEASNYIWGDDGNDILIGGRGNDGLYGGRGNDSYDGWFGDDTIVEDYHIQGSLVSNDDVISGGEGADYIQAGEGIDRIHGGPGADAIWPNGAHRDFFL
jgi:Ca2+-binding RTX toxin-like protein